MRKKNKETMRRLCRMVLDHEREIDATAYDKAISQFTVLRLYWALDCVLFGRETKVPDTCSLQEAFQAEEYEFEDWEEVSSELFWATTDPACSSITENALHYFCDSENWDCGIVPMYKLSASCETGCMVQEVGTLETDAAEELDFPDFITTKEAEFICQFKPDGTHGIFGDFECDEVCGALLLLSNRRIKHLRGLLAGKSRTDYTPEQQELLDEAGELLKRLQSCIYDTVSYEFGDHVTFIGSLLVDETCIQYSGAGPWLSTSLGACGWLLDDAIDRLTETLEGGKMNERE